MANKYYYLVSSLPVLAFEKRAPVAGEDFLSECSKWLTDSDLESLMRTKAKNLEKDPGERGFLKEWQDFDVDLRKAIAEARSARRLSHEEKIHGEAKDILDQSTPLDMEKRFERIRWSFLEERERDYHFDLNWLMVYYLKLEILERLAKFEPEEGRRVFTKASEVAHG